MSEPSNMVTNLRLMARLVRDYDYVEISRMLREAADTITSLWNSLTVSEAALDKAAGNWAKADSQIRENGGSEAVNEYEMHILCAEIKRQERVIEEQAERIRELEKLVIKVRNEYADAHYCAKAPWDYQLEEVDNWLAELGLEVSR